MKYIVLFFSILCFLACDKPSQISKDLGCSVNGYTSLKEYVGFKKNFTIQLPDYWKTNYYYDNSVSSIFAADTTLSLTKATMIDISYVSNVITLNQEFIQKISADHKKMGLEETISKKVSFLNKPSYYCVAQGKRGNYPYKVLNIFTTNDSGFLHMKTEVFGDSLIDQRICKALHLYNSITFN